MHAVGGRRRWQGALHSYTAPLRMIRSWQASRRQTRSWLHRVTGDSHSSEQHSRADSMLTTAAQHHSSWLTSHGCCACKGHQWLIPRQQCKPVQACTDHSLTFCEAAQDLRQIILKLFVLHCAGAAAFALPQARQRHLLLHPRPCSGISQQAAALAVPVPGGGL